MAGLPRSHIARLDVLRALAIALVVLVHYYWSVRDTISRETDAFWMPIFAWGINGVPLFFLVSGFCIHLSFLRSGPQPAKAFYWRRFTRIYPAYLASLVVFTIFAILRITDAINFKQFILHLFLIQNFFPSAIFYGINAPYWSMAVEFQFYLLYPFLLLLRSKFGLGKCLIGVLILTFVYQAICWKWPVIGMQVSNPTIVPDWYGWILGACLAEAYMQGKSFFPWKNGFLLITVVLMLVCYHFSELEFLRKLSVYLLFGALLQNYLAWPEELCWWERALVPVGLVSYSIYLWHYPFLKLIHQLLHKLFPTDTSLLWQMAVYLPVTVICVGPIVVTSYILFENRAMEWMRKWHRSKALRSREVLVNRSS